MSFFLCTFAQVLRKMKVLRTNEQIDIRQWKTLTRESRTGTWFQSPAAYNFFASFPKFLTPFVFALTHNEILRAVCVGFVTRETAVKQLFTRRAIILGGPALADDCSQDEVEELMTAVRSKLQSQAIYIETRNFNDYSPWREAFEKSGFAYRKHLNFHVDCTLDIKGCLSDNRKRQLNKSTALINENVNEAEINEWYSILVELYRTKVKTPLWPIEFFLEAYRQRIAQFMLVQHNGHIIGGSMVVTDGKCVYEWFECGLNMVYKEQYPSVKATYAGMEWAKAHGCNRYDMMGAGEPNVPYGVRDFKSEFGGELVEHGRFLCVCKPLLYQLGVLGVKMLKF